MGTHTLKIEAPECLSEPIKEVATPVAKSLGSSAGNTLSTAWELVFGGLDTKLEKVRYKRQKSIESFKAELDNKIEQIPSENLIEAKMHIVGPILEASKYYFEEEDLRAMFSSLIASSINKEKVDSVHPSFVEIIKQLSATDAQHLVEISNGYDLLDGIPMVNYALDTTGGGKKIILEHALATQIKDYKLDMELVEKTSNSLVNLERLGLIYLFNDQWFASFDYTFFENTNFYSEAVQYVKSKPNEFKSVKISKSMVKLTAFGETFIKACLS